MVQAWRLVWSRSRRARREASAGAAVGGSRGAEDGPARGPPPSSSCSLRGSVGTRRATFTVRKSCLIPPLGPGGPNATYESFEGSWLAGGAMNLFCGAAARSLPASCDSGPPSSSLGLGGGLAISRSSSPRFAYIAACGTRKELWAAVLWRWIVAMAENISVTLTIWKPFFVFVSHGSRGISQLRSWLARGSESIVTLYDRI